MEWKDENKFNSWNSWKGLTYLPQYKAIADWKEGRRTKPLPPIEISLDLFSGCQLFCQHCNYGKYLQEGKISKFEKDHLMNLIRFFSTWKEGEYGVNALCFGGGGESTLHPNMAEAITLSRSLGLDNSIATNGLNMTDNLLEAIPDGCKWVGISIDAATKETYKIGRRGDGFDTAIGNLKKLTKKIKEVNGRCSTCYRFLVFDYNQHEIYQAAKLAKELGVRDFNVRPADYSHQGVANKRDNQYKIECIKEQFEKCHELNDDNFHVYTVTHKFNSDFVPVRRFTQCYASPICLQIRPDGNCYLCPDTRNLEFYELGKHSPDPKAILEFWGSEKHYDLVFNSGCNNCKSRCTEGIYNEFCERLAINKDDPMDLNFI